MDRRTVTIESKFLALLRGLTAEEAGTIVQNFAALVDGEQPQSTGDRFLDYIAADMAECTDRIQEYSEVWRDAGRRGGRPRKTGVSESKRGVSETERGVSETERGVSETERGVSETERGVSESKRGVFEKKPTIPYHTVTVTVPDQTRPYQTEPLSNQTVTEPDGSDGSVRFCTSPNFGSGSGSADAGGSATPTYGPEAERFLNAVNDRSLPLAQTIAMEFGRGQWARYIATLGAGFVREAVNGLYSEMLAGEKPDNPAAVLTHRLKQAIEAQSNREGETP